VDYTTQPLRFKARKALRYARLYGVRTAIAKTQSQYHMKKHYPRLPSMSNRPTAGRHVGIIGAGKFAYSTIAFYLRRNFGHVLRCAMDINIHRAASLFEKYDLTYYTDSAEEILDDPAVDLVYIASNHASHAEYAIAALERGKSVHIEKPHVVSEEQLRRLCAAIANSSGQVALGFNRPKSRIGREIKRRLDEQTGPSMLNWFVAGHEIPTDHWYYAPEEGGRVLGNLCHWTDFVFQMIPPDRRFPIEINPTRGAQPDCDIGVTYTFGDDSIAAITFSAKGHTFEGVKERLTAHRGNALIAMDDFKTLVTEVVEKKHSVRLRYRDHGHERMVCDSYGLIWYSNGVRPSGCSSAYVWETGQLFLKTREALEADSRVRLESPQGLHQPG
jgi:predicted dehydrogenase